MPEEQAVSEPGSRPGGLPHGAAAVVLFMFFLSGVAALTYQIAWTKQLSLIFGVTVYATSAVVTAYMAGLALGSLYFGRVADRWKRPLVLFALLEAGIAGFALAFPAIATGIKHVYVVFYGPLGESHYVMSLVRFALSFLVLLIPTFLMGGTLPVLARAYVSRTKRLGGEVAGLYAVNNLGAFLGCLLAGYAFLEFLGIRGSSLLGVLLNAAVAVASLCLAARFGAAAGAAQPPVEQAADVAEAKLTGPVRVALWVFGIEGFTSLAYQMAWVRLLIFFVETDIYGVTVIVATYLVGLSLGAFLVKPWIDRVRNTFRLLGIIEIGIGVTALITIPLLPKFLSFYLPLDDALTTRGFVGWTIGRFLICFFFILVPTSFMGATMPVVSRIYVRAMKGLGRKMGIIGCLDTVGSILGAFAGGFIMIPLLGIQRTIIVTALINLALAAWMFWADPLTKRRVPFRLGFIASAAALLIAPVLLLLRPIPLINYSRIVRLERLGPGRLLFYSEDAESSVSVLDHYGVVRSLFVNQAVGAQSSRWDRASHEMVAHAPLLLHPDPKRALLIGFGIGFTTRACRVHGVDVDVAELSPGVRKANSLFTDLNQDILSDPHVYLRIDDGRNYVLGTDRKYDMIQAGIIHPALSSGNASFYSVDFYRECKRILTPDGVMCQWLPLHRIPPEDFKMLIRSFQAEFPYTSVWYKHTSDFCSLIGTPRPLAIDFQDLERRVNRPEMRDHLARSNVVDVYDFLDSFCFADDTAERALGEGPLQTDDHPYLEF
ncbi:MAG: fused MFS/spermidine synthase, partial [Planctomycetota bacterium]